MAELGITFETLLYSATPPGAGVGPTLPNQLVLAAQVADYDSATLGIPAGVDVYFILKSPGAGGGCGTGGSGTGGGGGAAGSWVMGRIPADAWATGVLINVKSGGAGAAAPSGNGTAALGCTITIDGNIALNGGTAGPGIGFGTGGNAAAPLIFDPIADAVVVKGLNGSANSGADGGAGATSPQAPYGLGGAGGSGGTLSGGDAGGLGAGGGGGADGGATGGDGSDGYGLLWWNSP